MLEYISTLPPAKRDIYIARNDTKLSTTYWANNYNYIANKEEIHMACLSSTGVEMHAGFVDVTDIIDCDEQVVLDVNNNIVETHAWKKQIPHTSTKQKCLEQKYID